MKDKEAFLRESLEKLKQLKTIETNSMRGRARAFERRASAEFDGIQVEIDICNVEISAFTRRINDVTGEIDRLTNIVNTLLKGREVARKKEIQEQRNLIIKSQRIKARKRMEGCRHDQ